MDLIVSEPSNWFSLSNYPATLSNVIPLGLNGSSQLISS